jgi:FkbH-like protein
MDSTVTADQAAAPALAALLEQFATGTDDRATVWTGLVGRIASLIKAGQFQDAADAIRRIVSPGLDYTQMQAAGRLYRRCQGHCQRSGTITRLAVLSSFTSHQLVEMIELFLFAGGVDAELYEAEYGVFRQELIDDKSKLFEFKPHSIFIATTWRDLTHIPPIDSNAEQVSKLVAQEQAEWTALWHLAHERSGGQIIQNNFDHPMWRQLGNHEMRHGASLGQFITQVNASFQLTAPPAVTIHDVDGLSALVGRRNWGDERFFHHAKLPCAPEYLVEYAHSVASILLAQLGQSKKCLVLDLDNTLWGGVIGDDGMGGIRLGQGDAEGEGYLAFQRYAQKLRQRGVILAVCSKNTDQVAREVFVKHPEMALKLDDISCFMANWDDKPANLRAIAQQLNIGLNSLVFLDDNPAERAIVRKLTPEVSVPEVSGDPLDFIAALERGRYFQTVSLGREDLQRTGYYLSNAQRRAVESSVENIAEFLRSLQMVATVGPITGMSLERSTQLINKSNQFNLTTVRRSSGEIQTIISDPTWLTLTVSLKDRFGDNGLISVLLAKTKGDALDIDTWLMSCRVLKRNVEQLLLNCICRWALQRGLKELRGHYIPTAKNELVKDHFTSLGFQTVARRADGSCDYVLDVRAFTPFETSIE